MRLKDRVGIVTGSGRGIGAATAIRLAEEGAKITVTDVNTDTCEETAQKIREAGGEAIAIPCDITKRQEVEDMVQKTVDAFGRLDILVNNAGVIRDNLVHKMTDEDWDIVMDVHLKGTFYASRAAQRFMVPNRYGKIVNFSSTSALGNRGQLNYSTAKAGIQGFTKTLAIELGKFNINVNAVAPGFIETDMTRQTAERIGVPFEDFKKAAAQTIPLGRTGKPIDVANAVLFLVSDEASFITGQVLYVRGGV
ncbi:SDR family NAD(P)-dependent oxidoreductase [Thermoactinomyces sp. CICC 10520]|jgi:3-oxoacyl-[acyl-carrier protein] reductase|uniref:SDR family NAD(P)-dependent oxidoreductase n=1 Tax=Thermoactinomyces sp. CICC 10520 TaxID=2767433 RepID=UPI0018DB82C5|nr:beta-ketoacyl-ACP reductase [Thermoactinomyces sp. CICC 10520]MBH8585206.1 beta-ketoacyl-ACP reductase [Thermoactinomyces sp. CICC 10520]